MKERKLSTNTVRKPYLFKETIDPDETEDYLVSVGKDFPDGFVIAFQNITLKEFHALDNPSPSLNLTKSITDHMHSAS